MRKMGKGIKIVGLVCALLLSLATTALAASTVTVDTPADGATTVTGSVTLDGAAVLDTGHTYQVDGGTAQALTVTGTAFTVDVSGLADGNHTMQAFVKVDEDGAGAGAATTVTASRSFAIVSGAVTVAAASGGGLSFTIPTSGLGASVTESLTSMSPMFLIVAGLVVGGGILGWGISMLKSWRGAR